MTPTLKMVGGTGSEARAVGREDAEELALRVARYALQSQAASTKRAYLSDWAHFAAWCAGREVQPLPATPDTVALYLAAHAEIYKVATLTRRLVAISQTHQASGYPDPPTRHSRVRGVWKGIKRELGTAQAGKLPLLPPDLRAMVAALPKTTLGVRDQAMILMGFAGAFRRSELVALDVSDILVTNAGLTVTIRRSKTDQEGKGRKVGLPLGENEETCLVRAYKAWLAESGITRGAVFRGVDRFGRLLPNRLTPHAVGRMVKRSAERVGLDPVLYAGHSFRAGFVTDATQRGVPTHKIRLQTGHKSDAMLGRYIRDAELYLGNAAAGSGL